MKWLIRAVIILLVLVAGPLFVASSGNLTLNGDWQTADRGSAGIAPDPARTPEAVVQVYAARAFSWRGILGVHTWIATKPENAARYTVYQVVGWRVRHGSPAVVSAPDTPDRAWFGNRPEVLAELRGPMAAKAIPAILAAVASYPYNDRYSVWPGPNSNTFTAYVARQVPELELDLPPTAIGKDYLPNGRIVERTPSGTGFQLSIYGLLGVMLAVEEGLEVNLLGLTLGIDPLGLAVKLPGVGRVDLLPN